MNLALAKFNADTFVWGLTFERHMSLAAIVSQQEKSQMFAQLVMRTVVLILHRNQTNVGTTKPEEP